MSGPKLKACGGSQFLQSSQGQLSKQTGALGKCRVTLGSDRANTTERLQAQTHQIAFRTTRMCPTPFPNLDLFLCCKKECCNMNKNATKICVRPDKRGKVIYLETK